MENFRIPTNPIQERLRAQRAADANTTPSSAANLRRVPVIPPISAQSSARSARAPPSLVPPNANATPVSSFPSLNSAQRVDSSGTGAKARKKVALEPGCSPLDWARLNSSGTNLRGIQPHEFPLRVNKELLKTHNKQNDCWTVLKGKVYNITPYVKFHPGGIDEIMKCAGRDGTSLFNKYHAWVNFERMLENCFIGFYTG